MIASCLRTNNLELAAALYTLGVPQFEIPVLHEHSTGKDVTVWCFQDRVEAVNKLLADKIAGVWEWEKFKAFEAANPDDPLSYLRVAFHNRERLLDQAKQGKQLHVVTRDSGKTYLVTL